MILINSGAYVNPEFQSEFGEIPPCFLPVGNKKLIEFQSEAILNSFPSIQIFLTVPESYKLSNDEKELLEDLNISYILSPDKFSLSEAILYALNIIDDPTNNEAVKLLHGDTLLSDKYPLIKDCIGVSEPISNYNWEPAYTENGKPYVWNGYFSFSSKKQLMQCLALAQGEFVKAIKLYDLQMSLSHNKFNLWFDFGHVNTYFRSRSKLTTERAFNSLSITNNVLRKKGEPSKKIQAESLWFQNIPNKLKIYTPQIISNSQLKEDCYYELEYLPILPLNELFVHCKKKDYEWLHIISEVEKFISKCKLESLSSSLADSIAKDFQNLVSSKTLSRIKDFSKTNNIDLDQEYQINGKLLPSINKIISICIEKTLALSPAPGVLHGDLCFSNVMFDARADQIKVIDPRGLNNEGEFTIYGDQKYDLAKLSHSINGLYDFIIAGRYNYKNLSSNNLELTFNISQDLKKLQNQFLKSTLAGVKIKDIQPLVVLLFLSMLPLHGDRPDRQNALFANALRIYSEI